MFDVEHPENWSAGAALSTPWPKKCRKLVWIQIAGAWQKLLIRCFTESICCYFKSGLEIRTFSIYVQQKNTTCWTTSGQQTFESSLLSQWQVDLRSSLATESALLTVFHFLIWKLSEGLSMAVLMPDENKPQGTRLLQSLRGRGEKKLCERTLWTKNPV